jgi:hypothetical protein
MGESHSSKRDAAAPVDFTLAEVVETSSESTLPGLRPLVDCNGLIQSHTGPLFRDDFVLAATTDDDASEYEQLKPPEGLSPAQRRAITTEPVPLTVEEEPERPLLQFSMTELLWLMTFVSAGFAIMHYLPPDHVAGVLGLLALVGQGLLMRFPPESRHIRLGASALLVMYACAAVVAFVQHVFFPPA